MVACLLTVHHVLPDDALEQLDSIDQMYHDGLLTEKVQAQTVQKSRCSGTMHLSTCWSCVAQGVDVRKRRVFQHAGLLHTPPPTMIIIGDKGKHELGCDVT